MSNREVEEKIAKIIEALDRVRNRIYIIGMVAGITYVLYLLLNKYFDMISFYNRVLDKIAKPNGLVTTVIVVFVIGIALFIFKLKQQFWYGVFETVFALLNCYFSAKSITPESKKLSILIVIGSSLYLIVRGLSNILDGTKKHFWMRNEVVGISENISSVSKMSLANALRDKRTLVNILSRVAKFVFRIT